MIERINECMHTFQSHGLTARECRNWSNVCLNAIQVALDKKMKKVSKEVNKQTDKETKKHKN